MSQFSVLAQGNYREFRNTCDGSQLSVNGHKLKRRQGNSPRPDKSQKILASLVEEPWQTLNELQYTWNIQDKHGIETIHKLMRDGLVERFTNGSTVLFGIPYRPLELPGYEPQALDFR
ncbi:hypothetical protein [Phaeobacter sp. 11ANDIMAR09]|uniref:hypothetical protein n=1 Tax=Phaeobacter sp. 11ANDIMAR09 TaxID=1225647 RepID=UPI000A7C4149|nr:hypothetical protein [Phaeobacter sp. 11ANDIMAR09]